MRARAVGPSAGAELVEATGATSDPGAWAAGTTALLAIGAAGHANTVAVAVHASLIEQDLVGGRPEATPPSHG